ncbi:DNA repair protein RecO [Lysobacter sp. CFH 32150]|uniref:DNA repair protein RecO n=1 Tax=Lysobacter sp. CFH 32150 TaxID=2927128 RepID=UPI001FA6EC25|nr:DNA repair protein RecO [Lysobacter sp. CFH 32150]MCI4567433.1 DNA repair protein RecO [Lysobacter sp. CFH 32150]
MRIEAEPAYVLHARPWRESSLLVEVLSEHHGRLGLVARGVQGPKRHVLRAALQPLQHIRLDAVQRGELAQLRAAEALDAAPQLQGDAALASFYLNELVLRLAPRSDPHPELYATYGETRARLGAGEPLAWTLRRFERDLLDALGFGIAFDVDGDGVPIDPAARYRLDPEHGARRLLSDRGHGDRTSAATGRALLALAEDRMPGVEDLTGLRRALRSVLEHHLGGRGLKSWEMLAELGRLAPARSG